MSVSEQIRTELQKLVNAFPASACSQAARIELSDTIVAVYVAGHISRAEYRDLMGYIR